MTVDLLLRIWSLRYPALRGADARAAARAHILGSLTRLAPHYRVGLLVALRLVPPALLLLTGRRPATAPPSALLGGLRRVERLPLLGRAVRTTETLALYSGLDAATAGSGTADARARRDAPVPRTAGRAVPR
ncbi:hypothetical protein [Kitasatospora sp. NPDC056184]|uniref:hypothetical protein n=1 Tax=Kitasatospora sp. NPDC056184 TaxID=3345738 RepID=UPI0035D74474